MSREAGWDEKAAKRGRHGCRPFSTGHGCPAENPGPAGRPAQRARRSGWPLWVPFLGHSRKGTRAPAGGRNHGAIGADTIAKPQIQSAEHASAAGIQIMARSATDRRAGSSGDNRPLRPLDPCLRRDDDQEQGVARIPSPPCQRSWHSKHGAQCNRSGSQASFMTFRFRALIAVP